MDTIYIPISVTQSGENVAGLSDDKAYEQFLSDLKQDSPMNQKERCHFLTLLFQQGRTLNRLIETPVLEPQF